MTVKERVIKYVEDNEIKVASPSKIAEALGETRQAVAYACKSAKIPTGPKRVARRKRKCRYCGGQVKVSGRRSPYDKHRKCWMKSGDGHGAKVTMVCDYKPCGKEFVKYRYRRKKRNYCTREHRDLAQKSGDWGKRSGPREPTPAA